MNANTVNWSAEIESAQITGRANLPCRVAIVDDDGLTRRCLADFIGRCVPHMRITATYRDGRSAVAGLASGRCGDDDMVDCILLDMSLSDTYAPAICRRIRRATPHMPILAMANPAENLYCDAVARNGGQGCVAKSTPQRIIAAIDSLVHNPRHALNGFDDPVSAHARIFLQSLKYPSLPSRVSELADLLTRHLSLDEAAREMDVSAATVRGYLLELRHHYDTPVTSEALLLWYDEYRVDYSHCQALQDI